MANAEEKRTERNQDRNNIKVLMAENFLLLTKAHQLTYSESIMEPKQDKCMEKHIYTYCGKSAENQRKRKKNITSSQIKRQLSKEQQ